jgi:hypothetical protein
MLSEADRGTAFRGVLAKCSQREEVDERAKRLRLQRAIGGVPSADDLVRALGALTRQAQRDFVAFDPGDRADRDQHLAPLPWVTLLEHDVGDQLVIVDEESVDVAEVVAVR